jgi:DNA-binding IclR family transcriptional regulator
VGQTLSGVGVLDKAMAVLEALEDGPLGLGDLVTATGLPRATAHRLAVALQAHGMVARDREGRFGLGPRVRSLGQAATGGRPGLVEAAAPALADLRDATGESAQLYVPEGSSRICVLSLESPHSLRTIVPVGAALPMGLGSAGRVLSGPPDDVGPGWVETVEERERGVASVSAGIVVDGVVRAAVSVSGPLERTSRAPGRRYGAAVVAAARRIEEALA